jgi:ketosteroid isomerase-like protein
MSAGEGGINANSVAAWLSGYTQAWLSYDAEMIGGLFSEDAEYRYHPHDEPLVGRKAIIASWLADADEPGTYEGSYRPVAVDGDIAVAVGTSSYRDTPGGEIVRVYDNCFLLRFDKAGRCAEFTEWYVKRPDA